LLGTVKEKRMAFRPTTAIEIEGKKLGKVKSKGSFIKRKHIVDFNGWHIEGNIRGRQYRILNGTEEIANFSRKVT